MVDRRLVWNQVAAPDLSAASAALARANDSFTSGLGSAQDIISQYGNGVLEKNDNALAAQLAGLGSEAEFQAFVDNGGLNNQNISPEMRQSVLEARRGQVDAAGVRARTGLTGAQTDAARARTSILQAQEGRAASQYAYGLKQRDEIAGLSGALVNARSEGRQYGNQGAPQGDIQQQVYQGMLDRGFPEHIAQGFMMNFQDESGFDPNVTEGTPNTHGTRGKGLYQLTGDRRKAYEAKYGNDYSINNQLDFLVQELGGSESGARDVIFNSSNAGEAASNIVNNFLRPASEHARERTARYIGDNGFTFTPSERRGTPANDAFREALANSKTLTPTQIDTLLGQVNGSIAAGQALQDDALARATAEGQQLVNETTANIINDTFNLPGVTTPGQVAQAISEDPRFKPLTASEQQDVQQQAQAYTETAAGSTLLNPPQSPKAAVQKAVLDQNIANTNAAANAALTSTDQNRAIRDINDFKEDPTAALTAALNLGKDGENPGGLGGLLGLESGFDQNKLKNLILEYARELKVKPSVAAVAMRDSYVADPFGRNTLRRRFDKDRVKEAAEQLDQASIRNYRERSSNNKLMEIELSSIQAQAASIQRQIAKTNSPAQKRVLQDQLAALSNQVAAIEKNRQNIPPKQ